jgi:hypothetical protein
MDRARGIRGGAAKTALSFLEGKDGDAVQNDEPPKKALEKYLTW